MLNVPIEFVRAHGASEWHHTSKHFNPTDYFDVAEIREHLEMPEGVEQLARIKSEIAARAAAPEIIHSNCTVHWLEWSGTRRHPYAAECTATGCRVVDRGGKFVEIEFPIDRPGWRGMRKGKTTRGFGVFSVDGKRIL